MHVYDSARLLFFASKYASELCPIVNGATGIGVKVSHVLESVKRAFNTDILIKFSGTPKEGDPANYIANIKRLNDWDFSPKIDLEEGINEYVRWFKADR